MSHDHRSIDRPAIDRGKLKSTRGEKNSVRDDGVDADCTSKFVLLDVNGVKKKKKPIRRGCSNFSQNKPYQISIIPKF